MAIDFEREVDRLYGVELDRFVEERAAVARSLREEGRRAEAARAGELRKPTLPAWTVNQLARRRRKDVDLLLDAAHRLAGAQAGVVAGGDPGRFAEARELERTALRKLEDAAAEVLGARAAESTLRRVAELLRNAAVSPEGRELLARGRLTVELEPAGFDALAAIAPPPSAHPTPKPKRKPTSKAPPAPSGRKTRPGRAIDEARERRETEARAKREQAAAQRQAVAQAREGLKSAREQERRLAEEVRSAQRALRAAEQERVRAERRLEELEDARELAARGVEDATRALDAARAAGY